MQKGYFKKTKSKMINICSYLSNIERMDFDEDGQ